MSRLIIRILSGNSGIEHLVNIYRPFQDLLKLSAEF